MKRLEGFVCTFVCTHTRLFSEVERCGAGRDGEEEVTGRGRKVSSGAAEVDVTGGGEKLLAAEGKVDSKCCKKENCM